MKQLSLFALLLLPTLGFSQHEIKPAEGFSHDIGSMVTMLEDLKERITEQVQDLDQAETDFQFDKNANSIGALVMHLISTEAYYQIETLEGRPWTKEEQNRLGMASELNDSSKEMFRGKPIQFYLDLWDEVRQKTLSGLKTKDDVWFASEIDEGLNYHYVWYHVMEHQANHMGQIALVKNRLPQ